MPLHLVATDRPIRPAPAGCDQQGRQQTRPAYAWPARRATLIGGHGTEQWPDTIATDFGSADALGDDQAERHSNWGALQECAVEGGRHREPSGTVRTKAPSLLPWALWLLGVVSAIAAAAALWP